jgi:TonB family protein
MKNTLLTIKHEPRAQRTARHARLAAPGLFICLLATPPVVLRAQAQTPNPAVSVQTSTAAPGSAERERAVAMIRQGDYKDAAGALRAAVKKNRQDADAWYYLGLALSRSDDNKEARKAFEQALKLRPESVDSRIGLAYALVQLNKLRDAEREIAKALALNPRHTEAHYVSGALAMRLNNFGHALAEAETALKINDDYHPALFLKTQALIGLSAESLTGDRKSDDAAAVEKRKELLDAASDSLEKFVSLNPKAPDIAHWREQLEALRLYARVNDKPDAARTIFSVREVTQRAIMYSKPEPDYPRRARQNNTTGTVRLRMVLGADGVVRHLLVVRGLPDGITEACLEAARKIKFTPAIKDGRPVSTAVMVEYGFNIY